MPRILERAVVGQHRYIENVFFGEPSRKRFPLRRVVNAHDGEHAFGFNRLIHLCERTYLRAVGAKDVKRGIDLDDDVGRAQILLVIGIFLQEGGRRQRLNERGGHIEVADVGFRIGDPQRGRIGFYRPNGCHETETQRRGKYCGRPFFSHFVFLPFIEIHA